MIDPLMTTVPNGLTALADLSDDVQPILFTHHRHVVEQTAHDG
jgi:hypothetical protein